MLSQFLEDHYARALFADHPEGVGYLLKHHVGDVPSFVEAVRRVAAGGTALDREVVSSLVRARDATGDGARLDALTPRERETLELIAQERGQTPAAVAAATTANARRLFGW